MLLLGRFHKPHTTFHGEKKNVKNHNEKGHSRLDAELVIWTEANKLYPFCFYKTHILW